jgi:tRNA A-37 threonylcarbamoyl transferase component Bud32
MSDGPQQPVQALPPTLAEGRLGHRDLLPLLRLLLKTQLTGVVHCQGQIAGEPVAGQIHLKLGQARAAFYGDQVGAVALTRMMLMGSGAFTVGTAATQPPRNISHDTGFLLDSIAKVIAETDFAQTAAAREAEPTPVPAGPSGALMSGPATERISVFHPPQLGEVIGKCRLDREIGHGASSTVFLAHHTALDVDVVVKVLLQEGGRSYHRTLTVNEAQLLARLNHPGIVRLFDFNDEGRHPYLIVEYIDGPSLSALVRERGRLPVAEALPLFLQIAEALAYADAALGLIHCDLKPDNILLTKDGRAKLADFGLAKSNRRGADVPSDVVVGTPSYIAPEQVRGGHASVDRRSDIYALGATFFHVLAGQPPFVDPDPIQVMLMRLDREPPAIADRVPGIDRRLADLIAAMLSRDLARRLDSYDELIESLIAILALEDRSDTNATVVGEVGNVIRRRTSFWRMVPNKLFGA